MLPIAIEMTSCLAQLYWTITDAQSALIYTLYKPLPKNEKDICFCLAIDFTYYECE
jgi:hypothetical protein